MKDVVALLVGGGSRCAAGSRRRRRKSRRRWILFSRGSRGAIRGRLPHHSLTSATEGEEELEVAVVDFLAHRWISSHRPPMGRELEATPGMSSWPPWGGDPEAVTTTIQPCARSRSWVLYALPPHFATPTAAALHHP